MAFVPLIFTAVCAAVVAVTMDVVKVPLPYPAIHHYVSDVPAHLLPVEPSPLEGIYESNTALQSAKKVLEGVIQGCESLTVTPDGRSVYLLDRYGYVWLGHIVEDKKTNSVDIVLDEERPRVVYLGAGRPLGAGLDKDGNLVVCDTGKGLVSVDVQSGRIEILANRVSEGTEVDPGSKITYPNDLDIGKDGTVYFTDSTDIPVIMNRQGYFDTFETYVLNMFQGKPTGRVLAYNPDTRVTKVLTSRIWYANGVALSEDESFLLFAETQSLKLYKYYLSGSKAGTREVLVENLPGHPDGISLASDGNFWVTLVAPPAPILKFLPYKPLRALGAHLPNFLRPKLNKWGVILKISPEGKVVGRLMDPDGAFISSTSAAHEHDGRLFIGNLAGDYVSIFDLKLLQKE